MKKALQKSHFRADLSVSKRAVGRRPCETGRSRSGNELAELDVAHGRGNSSRRRAVGSRRPRSVLARFFHTLGTTLRQRPGGEPKTPRLVLAEHVREPCRDLGLELRELECPRGRADRDVQGPVAAKPSR